jgi:hypothetical protein
MPISLKRTFSTNPAHSLHTRLLFFWFTVNNYLFFYGMPLLFACITEFLFFFGLFTGLSVASAAAYLIVPAASSMLFYRTVKRPAFL